LNDEIANHQNFNKRAQEKKRNKKGETNWKILYVTNKNWRVKLKKNKTLTKDTRIKTQNQKIND
jgi:hypothetical protein